MPEPSVTVTALLAALEGDGSLSIDWVPLLVLAAAVLTAADLWRTFSGAGRAVR